MKHWCHCTALSLLILMLLPWPAITQPGRNTNCTGSVFNDSNRNGLRDPGEKGIAGVAVSNGVDVALTDSRGDWTLPLGKGKDLFVIKPPAYQVPLDPDRIPLHFRPDFRGNHSGGDQGQQKPVHFPLTEDIYRERFSALIFSDTQARGLREVNFINHDIVAECIGTDAVFGLSLGDIVADDPMLFREISQGIAQIGIPWYNTFGNHDSDRSALDNEQRDQTFRRFFGPSAYAFEYGQVAFIVLNNVYFSETGKYRAHITSDQVMFVKNYLEIVPPDKLVVLAMHIPIVACDNKEELYGLLESRPHLFSISGHVHEQINLFLGKEHGWKGANPHHHLVCPAVSGSWWCGLTDERGIPHATMNDGSPNGYSVITFDGNSYSVRFRAAGRPENYQMNIYLPDEVETPAADTTAVLVNVFAGSDRSVVEMKAGPDGNWTTMAPVKTVDPACLQMHQLTPYLRETVLGKRLDEVLGWAMDFPSVSHHIWEARLPQGLTPGTHTVSVRTTDMYGQTWMSHRLFRIRNEKKESQ
jgi:hypothetical protein